MKLVPMTTAYWSLGGRDNAPAVGQGAKVADWGTTASREGELQRARAGGNEEPVEFLTGPVIEHNALCLGIYCCRGSSGEQLDTELAVVGAGVERYPLF